MKKTSSPKGILVEQSQRAWGWRHGHRCTVEQYWGIPKEDGVYDLVGGHLEARPMADERHQMICEFVVARVQVISKERVLGNSENENKKPARALASKIEKRRDEIRIPDVTIWEKEGKKT